MLVASAILRLLLGSRDSVVVSALAPPPPPRSHQRGLGLNPRCHIWVEFVVGSALSFSGYSGFPPSTKTNISKFQFTPKAAELRATLWISTEIHVYLFIFFILFKVEWYPKIRCLACNFPFLENGKIGIFKHSRIPF